MDNDFADRLKNRLKEKGLSQRELARRLGVSSPAVVAWTKGKSKTIQHDNLLGIARILGCTPEYLIYGDERPIRADEKIEVRYGRFVLALDRPQFIEEKKLDISFYSKNPAHKAVKVDNSMMEPEFKEGDVVILDTNVENIDSGSAYGIFINGKFLITYLDFSLSGGLIASVTHPKESVNVGDNPVIVGKVIMKTRRF